MLISEPVPAKTSDTLAVYVMLRRALPDGLSVMNMWLKVKRPHTEVDKLRSLGLGITQAKTFVHREGADPTWGWRLDHDPWGSTAAAIRALKEAA